MGNTAPHHLMQDKDWKKCGLDYNLIDEDCYAVGVDFMNFLEQQKVTLSRSSRAMSGLKPAEKGRPEEKTDVHVGWSEDPSWWNEVRGSIRQRNFLFFFLVCRSCTKRLLM